MAVFTDAVNAMLRHVKTSPLETVKAISESYVTCVGPHPYYECLADDGNTFNAYVAAATYNLNQGYRPQGDLNYCASNQMGPPVDLQGIEVAFCASFSLLFTPLCCDDIHDVTPRVSAYVGCDRPHPYYECLAVDGNTFNASFLLPLATYNLNHRYSSKSGNPTPSLDHILSTSLPSLTPFKGGDFILEEIEACLTNDLIPSGIDDADFDPEGDLLLLEKLLNDDPSFPLPPKELKFEEI
ncbi:hypothetical protein Tco_0688907 [Tanacetum coccineum]